jgi:hypothetical protein
MLSLVQQSTAGECARRLLDALNSGSDEGIHRALDGIADLNSSWSSDSQELEFRDLLAGIVEPMTAAVPEFLCAQKSSSKPVVLQMLAHVASAA